MRLDPRLRIGGPLGVIDVPQPGQPTRAQHIVQLLDFFGQLHNFLPGKKLFQWFQTFQGVQSFRPDPGTGLFRTHCWND
jgi:hypothetical protein